MKIDLEGAIAWIPALLSPAMSTESLRGEVILRWEDAGQPRWSVARTLGVAEQVDDAFERRELNPAPRFREARSAGDQIYLKTWIGGCRFVWLGGRAQARARSTEVPSSAGRAAQGVIGGSRRLNAVTPILFSIWSVLASTSWLRTINVSDSRTTERSLKNSRTTSAESRCTAYA